MLPKLAARECRANSQYGELSKEGEAFPFPSRFKTMPGELTLGEW
jgi:hypothetical protein